jgi:hypothetical protein
MYTKNELITKFKLLNYRLVYQKRHSYKTVNNTFFVFTEFYPKRNVQKGRVLVICEIIGKKYKIININDSIIYPSTYCSQVNDAFSKIVTNGYYFTIEQSSDTKYRKEIAHEYITFKYCVEELKYILEKYSIIIEHIDVDEYPWETLTKQEFGNIELNDFFIGILNPSLEKLPIQIFEKLQIPTYWIDKKDRK